MPGFQEAAAESLDQMMDEAVRAANETPALELATSYRSDCQRKRQDTAAFKRAPGAKTPQRRFAGAVRDTTVGGPG